MRKANAQLIRTLKKAGVDLQAVSVEDTIHALTELNQEHYQDYQPHPKQALFHEAGKTAKQRLFLAGNRTGKTFCACVEVVMHLTGIYPSWWKGYRFNHPVEAWVASNTAQTTKNILQEQYYLGKEGVLGYIPEHLITRMTRQNGIPDGIDTLYVKHSTGGISSLGFKSYDQGRAKFQGTKKHIIHFDEEPPYPVYAEALMRTMATHDHVGMLMITMTPLMGFTEMVQHFMEGQIAEEVSDGKFYLQASWDDNPHLSKSERQSILNSLKPHERAARQKGTPTLGLGLVYPVPEENIVVPSFEIPDWWPRVFGIDFGWSNPTAVLFAAHDRDNDILYCYGEYTNTELTPEQHATHLIKRGANWIPGVYDPAGKISSQKDGENLVKLYRESGLGYLSKADNAKEKGIMKVLQRLQNGQLKIFDTLSKTLSEYRIYSRGEDGIPKKGNDHLMDALRYIVMSGIPIARARGQQKTTAWQGGSSHPQTHDWMGL
jgi:phage terminase large subunit-like protein